MTPLRRRRCHIPKYIVLINFTEQGVKDTRNGPALRKANRERLQQMGITLDYYLTMGPYDAVAIADVPDDETAVLSLLAIGSQGNIRTLSMNAFTEEEGDRIIDRLPPA